MGLYIGVDLGTSAVKLLLMDEKGSILNTVSKEYPLEFPHPGWSQQAPEDWKKAVFQGIPQLLTGFDGKEVKGIGCGGQMHGLVILDAQDNVIRPAILWNDGRTAKQVDFLNNEVGKKVLSQRTANIAFAGFTAPKVLWVREEEPENFQRIAKLMLPKDYINYILTGVHSTDYSDASGMLLLVFSVIYVLLCAALGLMINLKLPNLNWTNETVAVKQSASVIVAMLANWGIAFLLIIGYIFLGDKLSQGLFLLLCTLLSAAASALALLWLKKRGQKILAHL